MASLLTLGYYSNYGGKPKTDYLFDKHPETCEFILQDIKSIIKLFLVPFVNSKQFLSASCFTVIGGPVYSNEKFKNLNPIQQINSNSSVKILKALFMQYPIEVMNALMILWNLECVAEFKSLDQKFIPT